jgi:hypothetical protein
MGLLHPHDATVENHIIRIKLNISGVPFMLQNIFYGATPMSVKKPRIASTVPFDMTFSGCGA